MHNLLIMTEIYFVICFIICYSKSDINKRTLTNAQVGTNGTNRPGCLASAQGGREVQLEWSG